MADFEKKIIVSVGLDSSEASQGVDELKGKLGTLNEVDTTKSVKSWKTEIREATLLAKQMEQQFGRNSDEFAAAAKKVANLKDKFGEFNASIQAFNPDNKLQALVGVAQGATGAIQGVTGAMAFLGVESGTAAETIAKLQGLMAFSQALNSVDDIKNSFKNFGSVIQSTTIFQKANVITTNLAAGAMRLLGISATQTGVAFTVLKGIIASTGIGLLIVGISTLITKIQEWTSSEDELADSIKYANLQLDIQKRLTNSQIEDSDARAKQELANARKRGASEQELTNIKVAGYQRDANIFIKSAQDKINKLNQIDGIHVRSINNMQDAQTAFDQVAKMEADVGDKADDASKKRLSAAKDYLTGIIADYKSANDQSQKVVDEQNEFEIKNADDRRNKQKQALDKSAQDRKQAYEKRLQEFKQEEEKYKQHYDELLKIASDAEREIALSKLNDKDKEIQEIENEFADRIKTEADAYKEDKNILDKHLKNKEITQSQYNDRVKQLIQVHNKAVEDLTELKGQKELEVTKRYNKEISDFINGFNETEYQKQREKLIEDFDAKIKVADDKQKELLEKLKTDEVNKLDNQETLRKDVVNKETNVIETKTENRVLDTDTPEERKSKLKAINDAEVELENSQFAEKLATLQGQQEEIEKATAEHKQRLTDLADQQAKEEEAIDKAKKEAKLSDLQAIGSAANALGDLIGKQTVAGKALGVAQATIDTFVGANKALAQGGIAGIAAAVGIIATGLVNVKKIISTKVPAKGGDTASSAPTITTAPVIQASQTKAATNAVSDVRVVNQKDQVVKAYITDRDLKDNEQKSDFLNKFSTIS